ncbi:MULTISPECIES: hypothetical protein [unclassified Streptomyces]|uniref:hypothetical protein n=1 Tax=unclassified Streptomyces TaxID=2593676 RepID=UPI002E76B577|nr:hypothetical protein [Streptomyces sp. JV184]MEE1745202.1 hypothetical protein [Streptomyces sp. JV184]
MASKTKPSGITARHCTAVTVRSDGRTSSQRIAAEKNSRIPARAEGPTDAYASLATAAPA